jgi:PhnB protein
MASVNAGIQQRHPNPVRRAMQVNPYLNFNGRANEALKFYQKALGAEVGMVMKFKDMPGEKAAAGSRPPANKIMHASFKVGDTVVFASDGRCGGKSEFKGVTLSLKAETDAEAERLFKALARGGEVQMPMAETFFASRFGMVNDKFGVAWMVIVEKPMAA